MLYSIIILPIELIVNWVFSFFYNTFSQYGVIAAIFGVSFTINLLALPLYNVADALQEKERKIARSLEDRVKRIKKAFKGDEQFMMLSTYYRQNNYHPLYVLRSSLSILIEIPFFIAAYHFLSHCPALMGSKFWIFSDLGKPDAFFHIGSFQINVLPILMTAINFISGVVYTKEAPMREKVQLYAVAAIFLVLLYSSPSGLVLYWILNNLFSLAKNVVKQQKNPLQLFHRLMSLVVCAVGVLFCIKTHSFTKRGIILAAMLVVVFADKLFLFAKKILGGKFTFEDQNDKYNLPLLLLSGAGLTLLCGVFLPSNVISSSPAEFSFLGKTDSPFAYIWSCFFVFTGFFIFWPLAIFKMFDIKIRRIESRLLGIIFLLSLANAFIFKFDYGNVGITFVIFANVFENISAFNVIGPVILLLLLFAIFYISEKVKNFSYVQMILLAICFAEIGMSVPKLTHISSHYKIAVAKKSESDNKVKVEPIYHFSKTGKNVVYIFLDRCISPIFSDFLKIESEYRQKLDGFTYYPNTLSFSTATCAGAPAMIGGYEYSPEEMNKRNTEFLVDKTTEASLILPYLFSEKGYEVTLTDSWAEKNRWREGYEPNSIPEYKSYEILSKFSDEFKRERNIDTGNGIDITVNNEIRNFSVLQILCPVHRGFFNKKFTISNNTDKFFDSTVNGFIDSFSVLYFLKRLTSFDAKKDQFIYMCNELNHDTLFLKDDYITLCEKNDPIWGNAKNIEGLKLAYLHTMAATFKQLCSWLDFLRENNVYDNTRIIIVSDHGYFLPFECFNSINSPDYPAAFAPILLVKDFNSRGSLKNNDDFMCNADSFFMAKKGLGLSEINPYTGKKFEIKKKDGINIYSIPLSDTIGDFVYNNKQFDITKDEAWHVSDDIFDSKKWIQLKQWENEDK